MEARIRPLTISLITAALLAPGASPTSAAQQEGRAQGAVEAQGASEEKIQEEVDEKLAERRRAMLEEAHAALDESYAALEALDEGKSKEALDALARATGRLELLVARDPALALAPVDVDFITHDVYASPEAIREARKEAERLLKEGKVQDARALLSGLASEFVIRVRNLPLATYPDAIKAISPLIDAGETEEAKASLRAALNTLVITDQVFSLPVLRARHMLDEAEELVKKEGPSDEEKEQIDQLVRQARVQLEMAELLGYGDAEDHREFRAQIAELEKKIGADGETKGVFARLRRSLEGFEASFFE